MVVLSCLLLAASGRPIPVMDPVTATILAGCEYEIILLLKIAVLYHPLAESTQDYLFLDELALHYL